MSIIEILMVTLWGCFAVYAIWYSTSAKHYAPITHKEARILWKIHRRNIKCNGGKWRKIRRGGKVVGFECTCGYRHMQKRPIVSNTPSPDVDLQDSQSSVLEKMHTLYRST